MTIPIHRVPATERLTTAWAQLAPQVDTLISRYLHDQPRAHLTGLLLTVGHAIDELTTPDPTETGEHRHDWTPWTKLPSFSGGADKHGRHCRGCDAQEVLGARFPPPA